MRTSGGMAATSVVPLMRYRDCAAAIDWLGRAFGFERHFVVGSDDGKVAYAQLTHGTGMVMLGPVGDTELDSHLKQPDEIGGSATQCCYLTVEDIEAHYARARESGAEIVLDLKAGSFGSRGYSCRDPEGHVWNFGSYDPWRGKRLPDVPEGRPLKARKGIVREMVVLGLCVSALAVTLSTVGKDWIPLDSWRAAWAPARVESAAGELSRSEAARVAAESSLGEAKLDVERERAARIQAEQGASAEVEKFAAGVRNELQNERSAREQAEAGLAQERAAKEAAERAAEDLKNRLATETRAREDAETQARRARDQLSRIEEEPKPDGSASVMTGSSAETAPAVTAPAPSVATEARQDTSAASDASPEAGKSVGPALRTPVRVKSWERQTKAAAKKRDQDETKPKKQVIITQPYKPKTAKPAAKPAAKSDIPLFSIL